MAVKGHDSSEEVINSFSQYTGLANLKVLAINPTKEELEKIGFKPKEEPVYTGITFYNKDSQGNDTEVTRNKVSFVLGNNDVKVRVDFLVAPEFDVAQTGSQRIINKKGQHTWSKNGIEGILTNPKMEWFESSTARQAYVGETQLIDFIREWLNAENDAEVCLDNPAAVMSGNVSELKNYIKIWPNNEVTVLLGVKEADNGKTYQSVYMRCFSRPTNKSAQKKFTNALNEQYGEFKVNYQDSLEYQQYKPKLSNDTPDKEVSSSGNEFA